jgi:group I intron endonuclease
MTQGVYAVTHIPTGRQYIGQSKRLEGRWYDHKCALIHNRHWKPEMQAAFDADGLESFSFTILEIVDDPARLREREQAHQDRHYAETGSYGFSESDSPESRKQRAIYLSRILKEGYARGHYSKAALTPGEYAAMLAELKEVVRQQEQERRAAFLAEMAEWEAARRLA